MSHTQLIALLNAAEYHIRHNNLNRHICYDDFQNFLIEEFDDNYYGEASLKFGKQTAIVESLWTDNDNNINIHIDSKHFEGDVLMKSLSMANQLRIIEMLKKHYQ